MSSTKDRERKRSKSSQQRRQSRQRKKQRRNKKIIRTILLIVIAIIILFVIGLVGYVIYQLVQKGGANQGIPVKGDTAVIVLDAGHGGADTGLENDELEEKEITMSIVSKVKIMLEGYGYKVVLTREDDSRISKEDRVQAANASDADLLVSVHLNFADNTEISGINAYYKKGSSQSEQLADKLMNSVISETGALKGELAEGNFTIVNETEMPAALIEVGYASSTEESQKLAEDTYRNDIAQGIAKGIIRSLTAN